MITIEYVRVVSNLCWQCNSPVALSREGNPLHWIGDQPFCVDCTNDYLAGQGQDVRVTAPGTGADKKTDRMVTGTQRRPA